MSGHSKWSTIKHKKGAADKKRGNIFTKHARAIAVAARDGADSGINFKLRIAIDAARSDNVPKGNIERAIARGSGSDGSEQMKSVVYDGFGPGGSALIIETVTDNLNRTVANIRHLVTKHGGNISGSVQWMFHRHGVLRLSKSAGFGDEFQLELIDIGADDVQEDDEGTTVLTAPEKLESVRSSIEKKGWKIEEAQIAWIPKEPLDLSEGDAQKLQKLIGVLEEDDDVQSVTTNAVL